MGVNRNRTFSTEVMYARVTSDATSNRPGGGNYRINGDERVAGSLCRVEVSGPAKEPNADGR